MANEVVASGLTDLISGEVMATEFLMLLADRDNSILTHPALFHATGNSATSNVVRVPHLGLGGYDLLTATTPGSEHANTAFSDGSTDVTVAPRAKVYSIDDLAQYLSDGKLNPMALAQDAAMSVAQTLISLLANVADDFSSQAGATGVNATWNDVVDAKTLLGIAKASGPMLGMIHPRQWGDLELDALTLGLAADAGMGGVINVGLDQFKGRWLGVDFFSASAVPTANGGADRAGGIFTRGGIAWADVQLAAEADPNIIDLGRARFERSRKGTYLLTSYVTSFMAGVAKAIDGAGVSLVTDA